MMSIDDKIDSAIKQIETSYPGGLSNTSTKRFDKLIPILSELADVPESEIYPTYVKRASNVWNRLSNGKPLNKHFAFAAVLGTTGDESGILAPLSSFIGDGFVHYDTIAILTMDASSRWVIQHVVTNAKNDCVLKIRQTYPNALLHLLNLAPVSNMAVVRACVFNDLEKKFEDWLPDHEVTSPGKITHYVQRLKAVFEPPVPHTKPTERWFGLYHDLMGKDPECPIFSVSGKKDFEEKFGSIIPFFMAEYEDKEKLEERYPCKEFDRLFSFVHAAPSKKEIVEKDNQTTRGGFRKFILFLDDLEKFVEEQSTSGYIRQVIYYGAPGTGKSFQTNKVVNQFPDTIRTTFHPDSDYASFVGCYKPTMKLRTKFDLSGQPIKVGGKLLQEDVVGYEFVPQAFTKAYVLAWKKAAAAKDGEHPVPQFLVIEEINRGNCAQIFGDLFQLLDRDDAQYSKYPVDPDADLTKHLETELKDVKATSSAVARIDVALAEAKASWEDVRTGRKLVLPPNLFIWATMNTSDQSLFPMDSAFKRRWDWKYEKIRMPKTKTDGTIWEDWTIQIPANDKVGKPAADYAWNDFLEAINRKIGELTSSEDKKLGYFFVKGDSSGAIPLDAFVNKVVFYLWNDAFRAVGTEELGFEGEFEERKNGRTEKKKRMVQFEDFFDTDGNPDPERIRDFLDKLEVTPEKPKSGASAVGGAPASSGASAASASTGSAPAAPLGAEDSADAADSAPAAPGNP